MLPPLLGSHVGHCCAAYGQRHGGTHSVTVGVVSVRAVHAVSGSTDSCGIVCHAVADLFSRIVRAIRVLPCVVIPVIVVGFEAASRTFHSTPPPLVSTDQDM